jgi:hypothetical protein
MEALPLAASFITVVRAVADILKRFRKHQEADALEKAATSIETKGPISRSQAKDTLAETLTHELGEEKARPLIEYTEMVETFFPFRPTGSLLQYGVAIGELILQIHQLLSKLQAFQLYGKRSASNCRLEFLQSGLPFYGVGAQSELFPSYVQVYGLSAYMYDRPHMLLGGPKARFTNSPGDFFVLEAEHSKQIFPIFVEADESLPFSLIFSNKEGKRVEKRLEPYQFRFCMEGLLNDSKHYVEQVAQEFEKSKQEAKEFSEAMSALKELMKVS